MKDIIKKLGIKPIYIWQTVCSATEARELEQQRNEMLEILINDILGSEKSWLENWLDSPDLDPLTTDEEIIQKCHEANKNKISIIEKACYPKTWEEIKELVIDSKPEPVQLIQKDIIDPKDWDMDADIPPEAE